MPDVRNASTVYCNQHLGDYECEVRDSDGKLHEFTVSSIQWFNATGQVNQMGEIEVSPSPNFTGWHCGTEDNSLVCGFTSHHKD